MNKIFLLLFVAVLATIFIISCGKNEYPERNKKGKDAVVKKKDGNQQDPQLEPTPADQNEGVKSVVLNFSLNDHSQIIITQNKEVKDQISPHHASDNTFVFKRDGSKLIPILLSNATNALIRFSVYDAMCYPKCPKNVPLTYLTKDEQAGFYLPDADTTYIVYLEDASGNMNYKFVYYNLKFTN